MPNWVTVRVAESTWDNNRKPQGGAIPSGRGVGKGVQRLDLKQDKKLRKEGVGASIPGRGWCLEALPAPAVCPRAVVPVDSRGLSKHDCEPQVPGSGTFVPWDQAGSRRL